MTHSFPTRRCSDLFGLDTRGLGLLARGREFLALPEIGGEGDDLAIIGLLEPFEDHARVQPARIGKDDSVDLLGHGRQLRGGESRRALRPPLRECNRAQQPRPERARRRCPRSGWTRGMPGPQKRGREGKGVAKNKPTRTTRDREKKKNRKTG